MLWTIPREQNNNRFRRSRIYDAAYAQYVLSMVYYRSAQHVPGRYAAIRRLRPIRLIVEHG